jgi:hypothetical protein
MVLEILTKAGIILWTSLATLWASFVTLLPEIIAAVIVIFVGWLIGKIAGKIVLRRVLRRVGLDRWIKREGLSGALWGRNLSSVLGSLLKWYIILMFAIEAVSLIPISILMPISSTFRLYLHVLFGSLLVLIISSILAEKIKRYVITSEVPYRDALGGIVKLLIMYFALVVILQIAGFQIEIMVDVFRIAFTAFAITIAIVVGIGFGMALKEDAKEIMGEFRKDRKRRRPKPPLSP